MITINLDYPIMSNDTTISTLTMRRPKVRDRIQAANVEANNAEREIYLLAILCNIPKEVILELDLSDYLKLQEQLMYFIEPPGE